MKIIKNLATSATLFALPLLTFAQSAGLANSADGGQFGVLLVELLDLTNTLLIPFILGIGFLVFVWGMFRYFIAGGANDEAKESGKSLMIYATLGFVLIIIFWGIVNLVATSTGLDDNAVDFNSNSLNNIEVTIPVSP